MRKDGQKVINIISKYIFNKMEKRFIKVDSTNLPKINIFMIIELLKIDGRYNVPELRGAKAFQ